MTKSQFLPGENLTLTCSHRVNRLEVETFLDRAENQIVNFFSDHPDRPIISIDKKDLKVQLIKAFLSHQYLYVIITFKLSDGHLHMSANPYTRSDYPDSDTDLCNYCAKWVL